MNVEIYTYRYSAIPVYTERKMAFEVGQECIKVYNFQTKAKTVNTGGRFPVYVLGYYTIV